MISRRKYENNVKEIVRKIGKIDADLLGHCDHININEGAPPCFDKVALLMQAGLTSEEANILSFELSAILMDSQWFPPEITNDQEKIKQYYLECQSNKVKTLPHGPYRYSRAILVHGEFIQHWVGNNKAIMQALTNERNWDKNNEHIRTT